MDKTKQKSNLPMCCESCKAHSKSDDEFRKIISLTNSGLSIYINTSGKTNINKDSVVLHNTGNKALKKHDFFGELSRRKTKCYLCNTLIQRVCNLINEVTEVKENEMIAVCEHCKRSTANKCRKCDEIVKKFLSNQINQYEYRQQALKIRLYEVRRILSLIVDKKNICNHKICQAYYDSNSELKILLELIKSPLPSKRLDIEEYFSIMETRKDSTQENVDNNLFLKCSGLFYEAKDSTNDLTSESRSESFCICKYLRNRNVDSTPSLTFLPSTPDNIPELVPPSKPDTISATNILKDVTKKSSAEKTPILKNKEQKKSPQKKSNEKKKIDKDHDKENVSINKQKDEKSAEGKKSKVKEDSNYKMMMKLIKDKDKEKKHEKSGKKDIIPPMPTIGDLPEIKKIAANKVEVASEISESIVECGQDEPSKLDKAVHGNRIVPLQKLNKVYSSENEPLIFKIEHEFGSIEKTPSKTVTSTSGRTTTTKKQVNASVDIEFPGIIKYQLSNKKFIEKGWTQLPTTKIVRKMNIYKMVPAYPQFDWFVNHQKQNLTYTTGEKLAEVDDNGCGRWFYKNGRVALEYYKSQDVNKGLKYVVYDINDLTEVKKSKLRKELALFDHLGNGIVYDKFGNVRLKYNQSEGLVVDKKLGPPGKWKWHTLNESTLKYNQSEGLVVDKKLGPPGKWKWHTLNDPPVLEYVYIDTVEERDKCFQDVIKQNIDDPDLIKRVISERMIAIEFENFVKEKASKMLQSYKPFEIRMKAVKINEYFSVRIINQANIQLLFRCNQASLKVNMGMLLLSNEIIDTRKSDVADVATPLERCISRPQSAESL